MTNYEITPATSEDAEIIGKLRADSWHEQYGSLEETDTEWIDKQVERITSNKSTKLRALSISESLQPNASTFWRVARLKKDHIIVGFIDARKLEDGTQEIHSIHVKKGYRNQGIGQKLLYEAHKWFNHTKPIFIDVAKNNLNAQRFYQRFPNNYHPNGYAYNFEQLQMIRLERK